MLAYYIEWHMRQRLKPMLFDDEHLDEANATRASPVVKAVRSDHAKAMGGLRVQRLVPKPTFSASMWG